MIAHRFRRPICLQELPKAKSAKGGKREKKDPAAPKRPKSSCESAAAHAAPLRIYKNLVQTATAIADLFFCATARTAVSAAEPGLSITEVATMLGESWRALDDEARRPHENAASVDRQRYASEMAEYKLVKAEALAEASSAKPGVAMKVEASLATAAAGKKAPKKAAGDGARAFCAICEDEGGKHLVCKGGCCQSFHVLCLGLASDEAFGSKPFVCDGCVVGLETCQVCRHLSPISEMERCNVKGCGKSFHTDCKVGTHRLSLRPIEQTAPPSLPCADSARVLQVELRKLEAEEFGLKEGTFVCPRHRWPHLQLAIESRDRLLTAALSSCANCKLAGTSKNRLLCCARCPLGYHKDCVPAGCVLHGTRILCPKHFDCSDQVGLHLLQPTVPQNKIALQRSKLTPYPNHRAGGRSPVRSAWCVATAASWSAATPVPASTIAAAWRAPKACSPSQLPTSRVRAPGANPPPTNSSRIASLPRAGARN